MTTENKKEHPRRRHTFIPAGVLIGLGVGLLTGYPGPGVLIGLGLGFLATSFLPAGGAPGTEGSSEKPLGMQKPAMTFIGIFMVIIGAGIAVAPLEIWLYLVPAFLILLGLWFAFRGIRPGS